MRYALNLVFPDGRVHTFAHHQDKTLKGEDIINFVMSEGFNQFYLVRRAIDISLDCNVYQEYEVIYSSDTQMLNYESILSANESFLESDVFKYWVLPASSGHEGIYKIYVKTPELYKYENYSIPIAFYHPDPYKVKYNISVYLPTYYVLDFSFEGNPTFKELNYYIITRYRQLYNFSHITDLSSYKLCTLSGLLPQKKRFFDDEIFKSEYYKQIEFNGTVRFKIEAFMELQDNYFKPVYDHLVKLLKGEDCIILDNFISPQKYTNYNLAMRESNKINPLQYHWLNSVFFGPNHNLCSPSCKITSNIMMHLGTLCNFKLQKEKKEYLKYKYYYISITLLYGKKRLCDAIRSSTHPISCVSLNEDITLPIPISRIPMYSKLNITVYVTTENEIDTIVAASTNYALFNSLGWLKKGTFEHGLFYCKNLNEYYPVCGNTSMDCPIITFSICMDIKNCVLWCPGQSQKTEMASSANHYNKIDVPNYNSFHSATYVDFSEAPEEEIKKLINERYKPVSYKNVGLIDFADLDYTDPNIFNEIPHMIKHFFDNQDDIKCVDVIYFLDVRFADPRLREYVVRFLDNHISDREFILFLLQLVEGLKFEMYDDSPLLRFLIKKGIEKPGTLGLHLFWQIFSERYNEAYLNRFTMLLQKLLNGMDDVNREKIINGFILSRALVDIHEELVSINDLEKASFALREKLKMIPIPKNLTLPVKPDITVSSIVIDKCKLLKSKKKPFLLVFERSSQFNDFKADNTVAILFKVGDDLRQDQLILRSLETMDHYWRQCGLDLRMSCYCCLPTGFMEGFIEVVPNSVTENSILTANNNSVTGAFFASGCIINHIKEMNPGKSLEDAKYNFMLSNAGYAVATCVLGIADRHPSNIMIRNDGHYFHIDFGHILGHFKSKAGYQRENAPFHFTPAHKEAMDGNLYDEFVENCTKAHKILRNNKEVLLMMFNMMLNVGLKELRPKDLLYMKNMLALDLSESKVEEFFKAKIEYSLNSWKTRINNMFHSLKN